MPPATTFPALELRPDGDVHVVKIKQSGSKPALKDLQTYLKKKAAITQLISYTYGERKLSLFGYTKGKEDEANQHEPPPPYESGTLYGSALLISYSASAGTWDAGAIEAFSVADYEVFYQKAYNGEIEQKGDDNEDEEATEAEVEDEEEEADADDEEAPVEDEEVGGEDELVVEEEEEEEEVVKPVRARRAPKVDPQQLQFQYTNDLKHQEMPSEDALTGPREKIVQGFAALLGATCSRKDLLTLEMGIFNAAIAEAITKNIPQSWQIEQFTWLYNMIAKRVASNFAPGSYIKNERLLQRWRDGEFSLDALGGWSHFDLNPDNWKELKDQQFRREKRILEGNTAMATDRFRCSRCQKKMCTYYELQTRSADEPMTIFITCVNCGKQWRQ